MEISENLNLPFIMPSQAQKHVTHNEAVRMLDALVQAGVETINADTPPASPNAGTRVVVGSTPTGAFAGQSGRLAAFQDDAWAFYAPKPGWVVWAEDEASLYAFDGAAWTLAGGADGAATLGVNTTADTVNRLAVAADASLFTHDSADHRLKINKAADTDTASVLFQNNFSGRAEFGLTGSDAFQLRTSPDGAAWTTQFSISPDHKRLEAPSFTTGQVNVAPNTVVTITPPRSSGFFFILHGGDSIYPQIPHAGIFVFDCGPSLDVTSVFLGDKMYNAGATALTGSSGTSGGTNVAVQDNAILIELRAFSNPQDFTYAFFC